MVTDKGRMLESKEFVAWINELGCNLHYITPEMHQANGQAERYMRTILNMLRIQANHKNLQWSETLWKLQLVLNITRQKTTQLAGKLDSGMRGPYKVVEVLPSGRYTLRLLGGSYGKTTQAAVQFMVPWRGEWSPETCAAFFENETNDDEETEVQIEFAPTAALSMPLLDEGVVTDPPTSPVAGPSGITRRNCVEDDSPSGEAV
ncbi:uncharacterized protein LOC118274469 isoform X2 [Spodoptera frugiperda]|uniref:Uncharacterized protein LOC118274469 isoform X2 n=1 Tax=Spodoptera frugiperda TaxID=7108 RepID=A0A9R0E6R1_SPOFR|nr:uncharacterized protein LOC118274469 isoform X2 [Spodoptera frugiperda]